MLCSLFPDGVSLSYSLILFYLLSPCVTVILFSFFANLICCLVFLSFIFFLLYSLSLSSCFVFLPLGLCCRLFFLLSPSLPLFPPYWFFLLYIPSLSPYSSFLRFLLSRCPFSSLVLSLVPSCHVFYLAVFPSCSLPVLFLLSLLPGLPSFTPSSPLVLRSISSLSVPPSRPSSALAL